MFAPTPVRVPSRIARNSTSEVTGTQRLSSANAMGMAAKHL